MVDVVTTDKSINEIAFEHGFDSHEVFTRAFKMAFGAPPSAFRNAHEEPYLFERANLLSNQNESGVMIMKPEIKQKEQSFWSALLKE
jgi:AraC-like DNA-binding protein